MAISDHWLFYPDIQAAGGLGPALEAEFARSNVALEVSGFGGESWARVAHELRFCQVSLGAEKRIIISDFWSHGFLYGHIQQADLRILAEAMATWLTQGTGLAVMIERYPFFRPNEGAAEFEAGNGVEHAWAKMDGWVARDLPRLTPLVNAAERSPQLRQLLPFTSHESLHFSRSMGFPYTNDVAHAVPIGDGHYRALGPEYRIAKATHRVQATGNDYHYEYADYDVLGEGDAEHMIGLIVATLPVGCGPAIMGTAQDLEKQS